MRKIKYTVNADGKVSPVARQWGGTQGEHNATEIIFDFSALYENFATEGWRIDFDSADAGFDPGGTIRPLLLENVISRAIPQKYTKNGGEMTAILVGTESAPDGSETVRIVCSIPVTIYFTEAERHEETEGQVVESLSEMERNVLQAAEAATEHIDAAEQRTLETVADIQQKLDNGDFVGEQGPKGDKGDTGPVGPQGVKGDSYNLTEADKSDIAKLINVDSKQDKFADVTERDGAVILTSTVSDDRPPQAILKNGVLELGAMLLKFGDGQGEVSLNGLNAPDDSLNINANDTRIRNVADPIFDKDAVNKKYFERNLPSVDQTYTPESTNAQSGIAVAEALKGKTLVDTTLTAEQAGTSVLFIEIPNWEILRNVSHIKTKVDIVPQSDLTKQAFECSITNNGGGTYQDMFCWSEVSGSAGETLYYRGVTHIFDLDSGIQDRREMISVYSPPTKLADGANTANGSIKAVSHLSFDSYTARPPYIRLYLRGGGLFAEGTKIRLEVM
jgi:hypothetical protein